MINLVKLNHFNLRSLFVVVFLLQGHVVFALTCKNLFEDSVLFQSRREFSIETQRQQINRALEQEVIYTISSYFKLPQSEISEFSKNWGGALRYAASDLIEIAEAANSPVHFDRSLVDQGILVVHIGDLKLHYNFDSHGAPIDRAQDLQDIFIDTLWSGNYIAVYSKILSEGIPFSQLKAEFTRRQLEEKIDSRRFNRVVRLVSSKKSMRFLEQTIRQSVVRIVSRGLYKETTKGIAKRLERSDTFARLSELIARKIAEARDQDREVSIMLEDRGEALAIILGSSRQELIINLRVDSTNQRILEDGLAAQDTFARMLLSNIEGVIKRAELLN